MVVGRLHESPTLALWLVACLQYYMGEGSGAGRDGIRLH